jgi:hypothetical protein
VPFSWITGDSVSAGGVVSVNLAADLLPLDARDQAPALASGLGGRTQTRCGSALVSPAPPTPATRPSRPLAQTHTLHAALT